MGYALGGGLAGSVGSPERSQHDGAVEGEHRNIRENFSEVPFISAKGNPSAGTKALPLEDQGWMHVLWLLPALPGECGNSIDLPVSQSRCLWRLSREDGVCIQTILR